MMAAHTRPYSARSGCYIDIDHNHDHELLPLLHAPPPPTMTLKLRASSSPEPGSPFSWDKVPASPQPSSSVDEAASSPPSPPTQWLSARDMKVFGASPLRATVGIVRCKDCEKPVLRSAMAEHAGEWRAVCAGGRGLSDDRYVPQSAHRSEERRQGKDGDTRCVAALCGSARLIDLQ